MLFEIGTGEVLVIESNFLDFINIELPQNHNACLAYSFYQDWLKNGGEAVNYGQCIGYKIPLFLGGKDEISNLEISDMDVYWTVLAQFKSQIK